MEARPSLFDYVLLSRNSSLQLRRANSSTGRLLASLVSWRAPGHSSLASRLPRLALCIPLVTQPRLAKLCDCGRLPERVRPAAVIIVMIRIDKQ